MRTVGIFGGSFNPPHVAHVLAAAYARMVFDLDEVRVIPVYQHPFSKHLAPFDDRLELCRLAFDGLPWVEVMDVERKLGGESRTLRTVRALREAEPQVTFRLILGSDVLSDLPKWHRFDEVATLAKPAILSRAGYPTGGVAGVLPELSSTEVRTAIREGASERLKVWLPSRVHQRVVELGLYREAGHAP